MQTAACPWRGVPPLLLHAGENRRGGENKPRSSIVRARERGREREKEEFNAPGGEKEEEEERRDAAAAVAAAAPDAAAARCKPLTARRLGRSVSHVYNFRRRRALSLSFSVYISII